MSRGFDPRGDDRGITFVVVALLITAMVTMTAFAVDLGRLRVERRNMQADADVIALDMLRLADGRTETQILLPGASPDFATVLAQSADANDVSVSELAVEYGVYDPTTDTFTQTGPVDVPNAVEVTATRSISYFFAGGGGTTTRQAVAATEDVTALTAGSYLVGMQVPGNAGLLNNLLASNVCPGATPADPPTCSFAFTGAGYNGLANANVTFDELAAAGGFGTPNELLEANLTQAQMATITATALNNQGDAAGAAIFTSIATEAAAQPSPSSQPICNPNDSSECVADVQGSNNEACLDNDVNTTCSAAEAGLNPFNMFMVFAQLANGNNFLDISAAGNPTVIPGVTINLSSTRYQIIEAAKQAIGPVGTQATSTQLRVQQSVDVTPPPVAGFSGSLTVNYELEGGKLISTVDAQRCNDDATLNTADFTTLARPLQGTIGQGNTPVGTFTLGLATLTVRIDKTIDASSQTSTPMPSMSIDETRSAVGTSATLGLFVTASDVSVTVTGLAGPAATAAEAAAKAALVPIINTVLTEANAAAQPALSNLGMAISSGDVTHDSTTCGNPVLRK